MKSSAFPAALVAVLAAIPLAARAQAPAETQATTYEDVTRALNAVEAAANAAREAAEASRASTDALRESLAAKEAKEAKEAKAAEAKAAEKTPWVYNLGVNLISVTGNANAVTAKVLGQVTGKWGEWGATAKGSAAYGQTTVENAAEATVTAQNADLSLRADRAFSERFGAYLTTGAATDRVASISLQYFGEAGIGVTWVEAKDKGADWTRTFLRTDLGFRATHEDRQTFFPEPLPASAQGRNIYAPRASLNFRYGLSKTAFFSQEAEILPDIQDSTNLRASTASIISAQIDKGIALQLGFKVRYIGQPADGAKTTDTELGTGVSWTF